MKKYNDKIEVNISSELKQLWKEKTQKLGLDMSRPIRQFIETDESIIVLGNGEEIVSTLYAIHAKLQECLKQQSIDAATVTTLKSQMEKVGCSLQAIRDHLTNFGKNGEDDDIVNS